MATRLLLAELLQDQPTPVAMESVGGVDAARRVAAGEVFDVAVLASDAIERLMGAGHLRPGSRVDIVHSGVAVAVRAGQPVPDISTEAALREAVLAARRLSYSTGPSGVALAALFARWGLADALAERTVVPPPGVPVGALVARGEADLGFQQFSELMHLEGITVLGSMPPGLEIVTTFSGAVCQSSTQPEAALALLQALATPATAAVKQRHGMAPA